MLKWLLIALGVIALDQASKQAIVHTLAYHEQWPVIPGFFNLVLAYNLGSAFSFLADAGGWQRHFFTALALVISAVIVVMIKRNPRDRRLCLPLSLVLGGAIGNVIDRICYGHVIDFLLVYFREWTYPAFNIADSAICIGVALMVLDGFFKRKEDK